MKVHLKFMEIYITALSVIFNRKGKFFKTVGVTALFESFLNAIIQFLQIAAQQILGLPIQHPVYCGQFNLNL